MDNYDLVLSLIKKGILQTPAVINAFRGIDRADFVPTTCLDQAYEDIPLPLGFGQTISQPSAVASMLEMLEIERGSKILDVGAGSGWTTALMAVITSSPGKVFGVERIPELVDYGSCCLAFYGFDWAEIRQAEKGVIGLPSEAPYDEILVSAEAKNLPQQLIGQLKNGGILVIPVNNSLWKVTKIRNDTYDVQTFPNYYFVPLVE